MRPKIAYSERYALAEELGAGGMGVVRRAVDRRLGRDVAIKTLRGKKPALERRFLREACMQALLDHPAIVPIYDIGRDVDGALYFSMKRITGSTFDAIFECPDAAKLPEAKLLEAFAQVCRAVHFAHRHGVVHRDLKPANIMLTEDGDVYVLDWGVALLTSPDGVETEDEETIGTPGYLAPEQARGATVDARADIYALGAILFELLAREPFHPRLTTATILVSTLRGRDARPSQRAPHRPIQPELDAICVKATLVNPSARFQTLAELLEALEPLLVEPKEVEGIPGLTPRRALPRYASFLVLVLILCTAVSSTAGVPLQRPPMRAIELDRQSQFVNIRAVPINPE